jgi:hypothetical protein
MQPITLTCCSAETSGPRSGSSSPGPIVSSSARGQPLHELVRDAALQEQARGRGADLAAVVEGARGGIGHGALEIGVGEHDHRVLAAELEDHGLDPVGGAREDAPAGRDRAGEADAAHQRVADQRLSGLRAETGDHVEHAVRQPGLLREPGEPEHGQGRLLGGLEDRRAARRQRRRQRAHRHAERKVPGHDVRGHALRLEQGEIDHLGSERDRRTLDLVGRAGVVDQRRDHAVDVAPRLADRLAHVAGLELCQLAPGNGQPG